ncbi:glycosyltransferase family 2 protein [Flavobacterium sp.]|uniref:glycosyltransferase family 2 protein n=1 Tax=Flavobacterium sp. TaxID=239 RepID=UPI00286C5F21|nr:glycosyltransferase family 2 protein [Flavobacterium sp.]
MKVAGFTFIRNAVQNDYSIVEAIESILPICDEFIVAHGNSNDDTLALIESIKSPKIKIIQTIWDDTVREGGKTFALETDKAFAAISPDMDWAFYIQGDECVHEKYLDTIKKEMEICLPNKKIEGLLFKYKHFYGSYDFYAHSRRWYHREIRIIRNIKGMQSYRDAQGFRFNGHKLKVKLIDAFMYHYGWVKAPNGLKTKIKNTGQFYSSDDEWIENTYNEDFVFDYGNAERLVKFDDTHPKVFQERVERINWKFTFDPRDLSNRLDFRRKFLGMFEQFTGVRLFAYKNYKRVK